jgi:hypothetical protein
MAVRDLLLLVCRDVDANDVRRFFVFCRGVAFISSSPSSCDSSSDIRLSDRVAGRRDSLGFLARLEEGVPGDGIDLVPTIVRDTVKPDKIWYGI